MTDDRDQWAELTNMWQDSPTRDIPDFQKRIRFISLRMRLVVGFEVLTSLVVMGFCIFLLYRRQDAFSIIVAVFGLIAISAAQYISLRLRVGTWHDKTTSVQEQVDLLIRRAQSSLKLVRYTYYSTIVVVVFIAIIHGSVYLGYHPTKNEVEWSNISLVIVILIVMCIATFIYGARSQRELDRLLTLQADLTKG